MNTLLKLAFISKRISQIKAAHEMGIDPAKLSKIIHGWIIPSHQEVNTLSEYLEIPINELFGEDESK